MHNRLAHNIHAESVARDAFSPREAIERDSGVHALQTLISALYDGNPSTVLAAEDRLADLNAQANAAIDCFNELADRRDSAARYPHTAIKARACITQAMRLVLAVSDLCTEVQAVVRQAKRMRTNSEAQRD